jgi:UDP-N-acetylmuramyl tripeptide synthase
LFAATELNEWALAASLRERDPVRWEGLESALRMAALESTTPPALPPLLDEAGALDRLVQLAAIEARPLLRIAVGRAATTGLGWLLDDEALSLGEGAGHAAFVLDSLSRPEVVHWANLRNVPTALVTGSNGKTTTVRLLAACARAQGLRAGYNCTDGVFLDGELLVAGDFSGPAGARSVLRDSRVEFAVIEAARGGILRRGVSVNRADVALVTNVSLDHVGAYGIDDLDAMAAVKLVIANAVGPGGLVVLNAGDSTLLRHASRIAAPVGWFGRDFDSPPLREARACGGSACGVLAGQLICSHRGETHELGDITSMPLTVDGSAAYNIENLAGAALAAVALGVAPDAIRTVFGRFGSNASDNPGRLMRYEVRGALAIIDYAHNPDGLRGLLEVARRLAGEGRLLMLLGQAGDRGDADIEALAAVAAKANPDLVVIKEMAGYLRGRAPGEVQAILRRALLAHGLPAGRVQERASEIEAAQAALDAARPGDVVLLLVHGVLARSEVMSMIRTQRRAD